jgi:archaellum biogenesis protein FlaJ (TadC family)
MFEDLKKNLDAEKEILRRLRDENDPLFLQSYVNQIKILNSSIPEFLKKVSSISNVRGSSVDLVGVTFSREIGSVYVRSGDKNLFLSQLEVLKKNDKSIEKSETQSYANVKPSFIRSISNSFFRGTAESLLPSMGDLSNSIKGANLTILPSTYLAVALFSTFISLFFGALVYGILLYLSLDYWIHFWIIPTTPIVVFLGFYYYPITEASNVQKSISYELPFATIHMSAIAGSDIEPTKIFEIIAGSKEYENIGKEMQKILVLIRIYGYDLVSSLKDVSKRTSSTKLAELLSGLSTNISGGGDLKTYLEKKSENFLLDYQLERRRYIDLASTFMDIYISILIAAPMVLMLMFIIMNVAGLGFQGMSIQLLLMISVVVIVIVNIMFIIAINLKQPKV